MTKNSILRAIAIPAAAIAVLYGAVTFVGCSSNEENPPPPPEPFRGHVFLDDILSTSLGTTSPNYLFMHNSSSPNGKFMFVAVNEAAEPGGAPTGKVIMYILDAADLENGKVTKLAETSATGASGATISFRSNWSADNSKVVLAARDRVYVIAVSADGTSMTVTDGPTFGADPLDSTQVENHDALPTQDGNYAVLTLRNKKDDGQGGAAVDGSLQLYDIANNQLVGDPISVCGGCHAPTKGTTLCGLDGALTGSGGNYTGTVYVAGHGGHFAKAALTIDAQSATPIVINSNSKLEVSAEKFVAGGSVPAGAVGTSTHKLHDARLDGNTLYWSTYTLDQNEKAHYGKIDVGGSSSSLVDIAVDLPSRATIGMKGTSLPAINAGPIYCASGQTATAFFPATMTNEAYITVVPKDDIQ